MKHFFTCLLGGLLLAGSALAQTTDPVRQKLDNIFANIDRSQVPTGRLREAAVPLAYLPGFDGSLHDSARTDIDGFRLLYATALSARVYGTETLPALADFNQSLQAAAPTTSTGAIPVAVQYVSYASLRPDAETAGLMTLQNEQLFDVADRFESPYQTAVLFAAAPERSYSASSTVSLVLPRSLYLASSTNPFATPTPYLDFGDGQGYRAAAWDQPLSTSYGTGGIKRIKVKLLYTNSFLTDYPAESTDAPVRYSETRESWFDLTVAAPTIAARYTADVTYSPDKGFNYPFAATTGFPVSATDYAHHLGAMVNVRFGQGHTSIKKPFIVVEGYNTAAIAPHLTGENN